MRKNIKAFFLHKFFNKKLKKASKFKRFFYNAIKLFWIACSNFFKHHLTLRASALTYFSLMAIVPFFALIFVIAKKIGYQESVEKELLLRFSEQKEIIIKVFEFAKNLIEEAKGGIITLVGLVFLFWSLIKLFSNLEKSINEIWQVKKGRNFRQRLSNHLAFMFVIPLFLVIIFSLKIYILNYFAQHEFVVGFFKVVLKILPYFLILSLFTFIYLFMPKAKVKFKYAFFSAFFSSLLYQLVQSVYINSQVEITRLNAIYGSFAALPLFLIWMQISWLIFLFGAQLNFAFQNLEKIKIKDLE